MKQLLADRFVQHVERNVLGAGELERLLDAIAARETDPYTVVDDITAARSQDRAPAQGMAIDHVGIAVSDLDAALTFYRDALGLEVEAPEDVASQRVRAHFIPAGSRPSSCSRARPTTRRSRSTSRSAARASTTSRFASPTSRAALARLKDKGVRLIDETPRAGAHGSLVAFVHPSSAHGVLVELKQATGGADQR